MRRALLLGWLACAGCDRPEQLLNVSGGIYANETPTDVTFSLQHDLGALDDGCTTFSTFDQVTVGADSGFSFDITRSETLGPLGTPRCFRLETPQSMGTMQLTWVPMANDVVLPTMVSPEFSYFDISVFPTAGVCTDPVVQCAVVAVDVPVQLAELIADQTYSFFPAQSVIELLLPDAGVLWRQTQLNPFVGVSLDVGMMEDQPLVYVRGSSFLVGETFQRDSVGLAVETGVEYRQVSELKTFYSALDHLPVSRGQTCDYADPCPFTDGDFAVVTLHAGVTEVNVELPNIDMRSQMEVRVRGLWVDSGFARVVLMDSASMTVLQTSVESPGDIAPGADGLAAQGRLDLASVIPAAAQLRFYVVDDDGVQQPITRLAEISVFQ